MKFSPLIIAAALAAFGIAAPIAAQAANTGTLNAQATVSSSATLNLTNTGGAVSTLTFAGVGGANVTPTEGVITVHAQVTTASANTSTKIMISGTDLTGINSSNVIPIGDLTWTNSTQSGGGTWSGGTMTTTAAQLASLPGSGTYSGDQSYSLAIPANANADTYTGVITYAITGF